MHDFTEDSAKEVSEPVFQPSNDSVSSAAAVITLSETAVTADAEATAPVVSACELNSESTNLLSMSKLARLGKDGLSSSLPAEIMSVIENSINASVTATLTADGPDLMRTLTTEEERVIQDLVQVGVCSRRE